MPRLSRKVIIFLVIVAIGTVTDSDVAVEMLIKPGDGVVFDEGRPEEEVRAIAADAYGDLLLALGAVG